MGVIRNHNSGECVLLYAQHVVGRNPLISNTYHSEEDISKSHATIFWENGGWKLHDHSRNGTMVNRQHLARIVTSLKEGDVVQFGNDEGTRWILYDEAAPTSYFISAEDSEKILSLASRKGVPSLDHPQVSYFYSIGRHLTLEREDVVLPLRSGTRVCFNDEGYGSHEWIFVENHILDDTVDYGRLVQSTCFDIYLSADEERISIQIKGGDWGLDLGTRSHHYLLLSLARKRIEDCEAEFAISDQGWIDMEDLSKDFSLEFQKDVDEYTINMHIHRLRKQLMKSKPYGYLFSDVIERKKGMVRFAHPGFRIIKEDHCLAEYFPKQAG